MNSRRDRKGTFLRNDLLVERQRVLQQLQAQRNTQLTRLNDLLEQKASKNLAAGARSNAGSSHTCRPAFYSQQASRQQEIEWTLGSESVESEAARAAKANAALKSGALVVCDGPMDGGNVKDAQHGEDHHSTVAFLMWHSMHWRAGRLWWPPDCI